MGPPPAKRQRRLVVLSSEDEEESHTKQEDEGEDHSSNQTISRHQDETRNKTRTLPTRLRSTHRSTSKYTRASTRKPSPGSSSPTKPALNPRTDVLRKDSKSSSLDTYFSAANRVHVTKGPASQTKKLGVSVEEEDFIEDDSFDDELWKLSDSRKTVRGREKGITAPSQGLTEKESSNKLPAGSQIFRGLGNGVGKADIEQKASELRRGDAGPWADRYGPTSIENLAVHKRKVADVREWLQSVFEGRSKKVPGSSTPCGDMAC